MANKGGDPKRGLIIALVCSSLLVIIVGAVAYSFYNDIEGARNETKDVKKNLSAKEKEREWYQYQALQMKNYMGVLLDKEDNSNFKVLRDKNPTGPDEPAFRKTLETLKARLGEDAEGRARESLLQRVNRLETELKAAKDGLDKERANLAKTTEDYKRFMDTKQQEFDELKKKFDEAQKAFVAAQKTLAEQYQAKIDELGDLSKEKSEVQKKAEVENGKRDKEIRQLKVMVGDRDQQINRLQDKITPPDLLRFSPPKGKIVRLEPKGEMAWINVGSADGIRAQQNLTFSIFGAGTDGRSTNQIRKGALEVVDVLGPHSAMAKITEVVEPARNPLLTGDLLINPSWSPQLRDHVAIAGLIDLTGDGNDYSEELMRNLRNQGVIIDAYLDLKDLMIKGDGMTVKTDYLIVGAAPEIGFESREGDRRTNRKTEIAAKMSSMQDEAKKLGVNVVPFRRFVELTGYRLPRGANVQERASYERGAASVERKEAPKKEDKSPGTEQKKENPDK
jgi:hypothetical protein